MNGYKTVKVIFGNETFNYTWLASNQFKDSVIKQDIGREQYIGKNNSNKAKIIDIIIDYTNKIN